MVGADPGSVSNSASQFRKRFTVPQDATRIGDAAMLLFIAESVFGYAGAISYALPTVALGEAAFTAR
jgi:hypothetical protein